MMNDVTIDDIDIEEGDFDDIDSTGDDVGDRIGKAVLTAFNTKRLRLTQSKFQTIRN